MQDLRDELRVLHSQSPQPNQSNGRGERKRGLQTGFSSSSSSSDAPPVALENLDRSVSIGSGAPPKTRPEQEGNGTGAVVPAQLSQLWKEVSSLRTQLQGSREELKRTLTSHENLLRDHEELTLALGDERGRNREFSTLQTKLKLVQFEAEDQKMRLDSVSGFIRMYLIYMCFGGRFSALLVYTFVIGSTEKRLPCLGLPFSWSKRGTP